MYCDLTSKFANSRNTITIFQKETKMPRQSKNYNFAYAVKSRYLAYYGTGFLHGFSNNISNKIRNFYLLTCSPNLELFKISAKISTALPRSEVKHLA